MPPRFQELEVLPPKRPFGIAILSVLHVAGGILGCLELMLGSAWFMAELRNSSLVLGVPLALVIGEFVFLFALALASGIGMWTGEKWGWQLGSFYYVFGVARNAVAFVRILMVTEHLSLPANADLSDEPLYYCSRHGAAVVIYFAIYLYFFKDHVRDFFSLAEAPMWRPIVAQVGICLAVFAGCVLLGAVMS
jgi:hypothetical protein